jgi:hypothetical protein
MISVNNPMADYPQERLTYMQAQDVAIYYAERRRRPEVKKEQGCIKPPQSILGGRFDVRT